MFETRITKLFNIEYPIICGGMYWLGRAELIAAVANAGGLGFITAATFPELADLRAEIRKARDLTDKPIGLNLNLFPAARPQPIEEWVQMAVEEKIPVVETSGRSPEPQVVSHIQSETEGNPLFVRETVRYLLETGQLTAQGELTVDPGTGQAPSRVPYRVRDVLSRRLEVLEPKLREVLDGTANIGIEPSLGYELVRRLQGFRVQTSSLLDCFRVRKSPQEIELIRHASRFAVLGVGWLLAASYRGSTVAEGFAETRTVVRRMIAEIDGWELSVATRRPANPEAVFNGIAFDPVTGHFFVTGKLWPNLFEIEILDR